MSKTYYTFEEYLKEFNPKRYKAEQDLREHQEKCNRCKGPFLLPCAFGEWLMYLAEEAKGPSSPIIPQRLVEGHYGN